MDTVERERHTIIVTTTTARYNDVSTQMDRVRLPPRKSDGPRPRQVAPQQILRESEIQQQKQITAYDGHTIQTDQTAFPAGELFVWKVLVETAWATRRQRRKLTAANVIGQFVDD